MKKTIFLTGATGKMGWAGFTELYATHNYQLRLLVRDSKKNRKKLQSFLHDPEVSIVWGDLLRYDDVLRGVTGADYVLHLGGMVSPAADYYPERTMRVNVQSTQHVVDAVKAQPNADDIRVVYIGSVAQYGDRRAPAHWGATGDPTFANPYDAYPVSKCLAEKIVVDSGLKHWVSLRQSGILYPGILKVINSTVYHVPLQGVLEWTTIEDAGRLLAKVCADDVPECFWNRFYNISSGKDYRMSNYEFEAKLLAKLGLPGPEKIFEPQWFALQNFHGMWFTDADVLENYLHFRQNIPVDEYFSRMKKALPWYYSLSFMAPAWAVKLFMKRFTDGDDTCTQYWVQHSPEKLRAYYGSQQQYDHITSWADVRPLPLQKDQQQASAAGEIMDVRCGYDTTKSIYSLSPDELQAAAAFRGGRFIGPVEKIGQPGQLFQWECEHGHRFESSLEYVLLGGGWCPTCMADNIRFEHTPKNEFFDQIQGLYRKEDDVR